MALSANTTVTLQAAAMAALSNAIAQAMTHYKSHSKLLVSDPSSIDIRRLGYFVLYALISTPPNFEWQMWLERAFPGSRTAPQSHKIEGSFEKAASKVSSTSATSTSKRNVLAKFLADQVIGGTINTLTFIAFFAYIEGKDVTAAIKRDFWPMRVASLTLWPAVSLLNYTVIPPQQRINFANLIGIGWGIYLSLLSM